MVSPTSSFDLSFKTSKVRGNDIIFGYSQTGGIAETTGVLSLTTPTPSLLGGGVITSTPRFGTLQLVAPSPSISGVASYNINTFTGFIIQYSVETANPAKLEVQANSPFQTPEVIESTSASKAEGGQSVLQGYVSLFEEATSLEVSTRAHGLEAEGVLNSYRLRAQEAVPISRMSSAEFEGTESLSYLYTGLYQIAEKLGSFTLEKYQGAEGTGTKALGFSFGSSEQVRATWDSKAEEAEPIPLEKEFEYEPPVVQLPNYDIEFKCLPYSGELSPYNYAIIFNSLCLLPPTEPTDYSETVFVKNTLTATNLNTGESFDLLKVDFSSDVDSFAWSGTMTLASSEVAKITSLDGNPVLITLDFNGKSALLMVRKLTRALSFNQPTFRVELISPTVVLDDPFKRPASFVLSEDETPQSIVETLLDTPNSGVSLEWGFLPPLEWVVKAGSFSYQELTPIKAIGALIAQSGAFVSSSLDAKTLHIKRRRPFCFWEPAPVDGKDISEHLLLSLSFEQTFNRNYTGVYVISGTTSAQGLNANVVRDGYNGFELAPQVLAPTLTSPSACREAGRYVLGGAGVVELRTVNLPIIEGEPLLLPADVVRFTFEGTLYTGTVQATSIAVSFNNQSQSVSIECVKGFA